LRGCWLCSFPFTSFTSCARSLADLEDSATVDNFPLPRGERVAAARQAHKDLLKEQRMESHFVRTALVL
jgi:hypothetical protein